MEVACVHAGAVALSCPTLHYLMDYITCQAPLGQRVGEEGGDRG